MHWAQGGALEEKEGKAGIRSQRFRHRKDKGEALFLSSAEQT